MKKKGKNKMIKINKKWYIDADKRCYILCKKTKRIDKETGKEIVTFTDKSYHPSVSSALSAFVKKMQLREVRINNMKIDEAIERFNQIEEIIIKSVNGKEM